MASSAAEDLKEWEDPIPAEERIQHEILFYSQGPVDGYMSGDKARDLFLHSRLPLTVLSKIWNLADVSNDNVLSVKEFVTAMHLIRKVRSGMSVPRSLPKHLVPVNTVPPSIEEMTDREIEAYQNVFNKLSQDQINAIQGRQLMLESQLSVEELSTLWDMADVNRDGQLDQHEWKVSCHLVRHLKQGGKLDGPVNVFQWMPEKLAPNSYQARKLRVEEYNKKKHELMTAKEKRKSQIDSETRRLDLLKRRFALHKELYQLPAVPKEPTEEEFKVYKEKEENNIEKVEAIIYRLKKEHESIRQETVKAILGEQGTLQEDGRLLKLEQEEVRSRLATSHTKATKDPDPFHQLYEIRKDLRKRSTLSEGEEPEVHFPFKLNPFDPTAAPQCLSGHTIFVSPDPSVLNNNNSHGQLSVKSDLYGFGEGFLERWSVEKQQADYDPIFMALNVPMDGQNWSGLEWRKDGVDSHIQTIHKKLVDLKTEMQKLNTDSGGQLLFRNPDDYLARRKAQEEDRLEKSKYPRRYQKSDGEKDVTKRRSYYMPRPDDEAQRIAREYRQKRRSLNFDKRSDNTDKSDKFDKSAIVKKEDSKVTEGADKPLEISTDSADSGFSPESASSPRAVSPEAGPRSPRSAVSPPRPSTKRKVAPPPPCSKKQAPESQSAPARTTTSVSSKSTTESAPKPLEATETSAPKSLPKPSVQTLPVDKKVEVSVTPKENTTATKDSSDQSVPSTTEIPQPNRPPRRKKKSVEESKATQDKIIKDQTANDISVEKVQVKLTAEDTELLSEPIIEEDKDSLLNSVIKDLPVFKDEKPVVEENVIEAKLVHTEESAPKSKTVISINGDLENEIKPVKIVKPRGKVIDTEISSKISFVEKDLSQSETKAEDTDNDTEVVTVTKVDNNRNTLIDFDDTDGYLDHVKPISFKKAPADDIDQIFHKIAIFEDRQKLKDSKDTISIASDISISSAGSEAPPLPDSLPPPLPAALPPVVQEEIQPQLVINVETVNPKMAETIPEITAPASPRELTSPISDLKASMFSMRVTSPTRDVDSMKSNGILTVDVGEKRTSNTDSDLSDCEDGSEVTGTFTPGERVTKDVPVNINEDTSDIQLISYSAKLNSPNSDHSGRDSAFEDMQSSNDPLSNTIEDFVTEETVTVTKVEKTESPPLPTSEVPRQFVLEFDSDEPKRAAVTSPTGNKDFMAKAQMFANTVQKPPKMTVKRKKEITSPDDITDERYIQLEAERRAVISSSTMKKKSVVTPTNLTDEASVEQPVEQEPEDSVQEWRADVSKRSNIHWEEKPEKVNLYSENVIQETDNTETVDRESIANLSSIRQQWESKFQTEKQNQNSAPKPKQTSSAVRHWEVKLPTQLKKVPADAIRTTKTDSDSDSENMAETENQSESAIEREIRLAMEREELLKKEKEERENLQERQNEPLKKDGFKSETIEENNNKPTYHEMTEADRGSELRQREELIQQELMEQEEREAAYRGQTNGTNGEQSDSSGVEDDNGEESIIEREIRLQREREQELEQNRVKLATTKIQEPIVEDTVTIQYNEPTRASPATVSTPDELSNISTPDNLSEAEELADMKARITYEEAISNASHDGESLIARELREAREREEELQKQRERLSNQTPATPRTEPPKKEPTPVKEEKPSYNKDVGPYKHARRQSTDSLSSGQSNEKPQSVTPKNVRITSFGTGVMSGLKYKAPETPKETKRQETPIEREIRLARERENELRVSKGLAPLEDVKKVDYDEVDSSDIVARPSFTSPNTNNRNNMQKFASSRLQKEINKQNEIEKKYREEGKIISTSEEHVGLIKYTEIAQNESTPKRNFSIQRKTVSSEPIKGQNGTLEVKVTSSPKVATNEPPKMSRSISGGVTFSYRESRHKAESKIEQELREMREREEELRKQRVGAGFTQPGSPRNPTDTSVQDKRSQFEQAS